MALALSLRPGVGPASYRELVSTFGCAGRAWEHLSRGSRQAGREAAAALCAARDAMRNAGRVGARLVLAGDVDYPTCLLELHHPPPRLFVAGDLEMLRPPVVAIVGTRSSTPYGERVTRALAEALARAGASVISGMARGVDGTAHRAALAVGGRTAAVLGTGLDVVYPAAHRALHAELRRRGLLISEELPGDRASAGSFPRRNRIIAALAQVVIVVEAGTKSGAINTAGHALELGRTVAAVPGPVDSAQSTGANLLLRDGAALIAEVADALALVGLTAAAAVEPPNASAAEGAVWRALARGALNLDALAAQAGLPARECLAAVSALELSGAIECALTGEIRRR